MIYIGYEQKINFIHTFVNPDQEKDETAFKNPKCMIGKEFICVPNIYISQIIAVSFVFRI